MLFLVSHPGSVSGRANLGTGVVSTVPGLKPRHNLLSMPKGAAACQEHAPPKPQVSGLHL